MSSSPDHFKRYSTLLTTKRAVLTVDCCRVYLTSSKSDPEGSLAAFEYFDIIVYEVLPMLALPCLAGRIFMIVRRQERRMRVQMRQVRFNRQAEPGSEMSSHNRRTATMKFICGAVAVFGFCYLCETIITVYPLITGLYAGKAKILTYDHVLMLLFIVNSAINPVVYALFKSDIKRSLKRMVHRNRTVLTWAKAPRATNMEMNNADDSKNNEKWWCLMAMMVIIQMMKTKKTIMMVNEEIPSASARRYFYSFSNQPRQTGFGYRLFDKLHHACIISYCKAELWMYKPHP